MIAKEQKNIKIKKNEINQKPKTKKNLKMMCENDCGAVDISENVHWSRMFFGQFTNSSVIMYKMQSTVFRIGWEETLKWMVRMWNGKLTSGSILEDAGTVGGSGGEGIGGFFCRKLLAAGGVM